MAEPSEAMSEATEITVRRWCGACQTTTAHEVQLAMQSTESGSIHRDENRKYAVAPHRVEVCFQCGARASRWVR